MILHVALLSLLFVAINGLFVAAEFALIGSPKAALARKAAQGNRTAKRVLDTLRSPPRQDRYLATSQLAITLASLGLGMYGEHALAGILEAHLWRLSFAGSAAVASTLALLILTLAHIVIGEMVPKGVALQHSVEVARVTNWPMRVTLIVLYPIVRLSSAIAALTLRLIGIRRTAGQHEVYTPEELQLIVEESASGGALRAESGRILRELFEFGDRTAAQVMVPRVRVVGIRIGATTEELRRIVLAHRRTRYAVYDGDLDHIAGMLHVKDVLRRLLSGGAVAASDARRMPVVPETASLDDVLTTMQTGGAHMATVVDEHGGTAGIVSLEDLFEEVVGELDEGVPAAPPLAPAADGSVKAAGTVRLDELGRCFDVDIEHEEVESVSGLVLQLLGRPPVAGDVVAYGRLRLEVTRVTGRGVGEVRATLAPG